MPKDQKDNLCNNSKISNQDNPLIEPINRGDPLLKQTKKMCQMVAKHVLVMKAYDSTLETKTLRGTSGQHVVSHDDSRNWQTMLNEVNMDFRIPVLPHSVLKHAPSTSVPDLFHKIENHPDRHAFQQDPRQDQAYNPSSPESQTEDSGRWKRGAV